jgi:hypothetical protein
MMKETALAKIYMEQFRPLVLLLYSEAGLVIPLDFDPAVEGPRLIATFREQGMKTKFKTVGGREVK